MTDAPTRDELAENVMRCNLEAKRLVGTVYYAGKHADINLALDEWQATEASPSLTATP